MVADFNKKGNREFFSNKIMFQTIGIIFLVVIVILISIDFRMYQKKRELISKINDYQKQIEDIKKSNQTLKDEINNSDNIDYLEKIAYEQLGEARPGETVYSFVMPKEKPKTTAETKSFWDNFTGWISGKVGWISGQLFGNKSTAN
jgi:cell division protein FtsB